MINSSKRVVPVAAFVMLGVALSPSAAASDSVASTTVAPVSGRADAMVDPLDLVDPTSGPTAPVALAMITAGRDAEMTWEPPLSDGGSPIRTYQVLRHMTSSNPWEYEHFPTTVYAQGTRQVWKDLHAGETYNSPSKRSTALAIMETGLRTCM